MEAKRDATNSPGFGQLPDAGKKVSTFLVTQQQRLGRNRHITNTYKDRMFNSCCQKSISNY